jgi:AcrR family transcriptional regulator
LARTNRTDAILNAAEELLRNRRFDEVTLDAVAEAAHVGKGTIYRYFKDKDDLFFQLAERGPSELCKMIEKSASAGGNVPFRKRLEKVCGQISDFFMKRRALIRLMSEQWERMGALKMKKKEICMKHRGDMRTALAKVLAAGVEKGELRGDIPLERQAHFLLSLMHSRHHPFGHEDIEKPSIGAIIDVFLNGVKSR